LLQSFGGFLLGLEAFSYVVPDIFIDTMGYSFTYPLFKYLGQSEVVCYVHYPTISYDMLEVVRQRTSTYNNNSAIAQSPLMSRLKEFYYEYFATAYGFAGRCADVVMANSSWTKMHLDIIWEVPQKVKIVYPPCDTANFSKFSLEGRGNLIVSIAQFRPEKNHKLQLDAFHKYVSSPGASPDARLMLIGGARNEEDLARVKDLEDHANKLELGGRVAIVVNMPFSELKKMLSSAKIGLHSMWNEHFGIGVVEYMAAGCITAAHNSGGPKMDIVVPYGSQATGFLASTVEEYADTFKQIYEMSEEECLKMQEAARANVCERFSEDIFSRKFISSLSPLLKKLELE
jgi:alpha-1,2-mannosyltransferase